MRVMSGRAMFAKAASGGESPVSMRHAKLTGSPILKVGQEMPDKTIYAGNTGEGRLLFIVPNLLVMTWDKAVQHAQTKPLLGLPSGTFQLPTIPELSVVTANWRFLSSRVSVAPSAFSHDVWSSNKHPSGNSTYVLTLGTHTKPEYKKMLGNRIKALACFIRSEPA